MRVLVVDDDPYIRRLVAEALGDQGHVVHQAANGAAALEEVVDAPPDVILLDMTMPVMDGWEFARRYRARPGPHAPLACMTAGGWAAQRGGEIGASAVLAKPFALEDLDAVIRRLTTEPTR